jgi:hypothetical protein
MGALFLPVNRFSATRGSRSARNDLAERRFRRAARQRHTASFFSGYRRVLYRRMVTFRALIFWSILGFRFDDRRRPR